MFFVPVLFGFRVTNSGDHCLLAGFPFSRTDFSELVSVLESLQQSQNFVNASSDRQVVDTVLSQNALGIDDEGASQGNSFVFSVVKVNSVVFAGLVSVVGEKGNVAGSETSLLPRLQGPLSVRKFGISGASNNFGI